jgi:glutamate racemase
VTPSPIGVFDSGIGGISVLKALRAELPAEDFVYIADSAHAPYGERDPEHVIERARAISLYLRGQHDIKALVVACNTATAAAIDVLRQQHPQLPIVGVEPAIKPASLKSRTRRAGVMATRGTLESPRFRSLLNSLEGTVEFVTQACDGLADAIERGDKEKVEALCRTYTQAMGSFGLDAGQIDTVVLGCTHYPFATANLRNLLGSDVALLDSGIPVARQTRRLLEMRAQLSSAPGLGTRLFTTGSSERLKFAAINWLELEVEVTSVSI